MSSELTFKLPQQTGRNKPNEREIYDEKQNRYACDIKNEKNIRPPARSDGKPQTNDASHTPTNLKLHTSACKEDANRQPTQMSEKHLKIFFFSKN